MEAAYVISAHGRSVRTRAFLAKQYTADLEPSRRSDFHRARPVIPPECSPLCFAECHHGRRRHRLLGFQIPIQLLASDHRDPRRPYSDRHRPHVGGPWLDFFKPGTPAFPEYPSAHASISGSAAFILASIFGDNTSFTVISESRPGTRSFSVSLAPLQKSLTFVSSAASISALPASSATRWEARSRTMYRGTPCAAR